MLNMYLPPKARAVEIIYIVIQSIQKNALQIFKCTLELKHSIKDEKHILSPLLLLL